MEFRRKKIRVRKKNTTGRLCPGSAVFSLFSDCLWAVVTAGAVRA